MPRRVPQGSAPGIAAPIRAILVAAGLSACAGDGRCVLHPVAALRTLAPQGLPLVRVMVAGRPAVFVIDTGASESLLAGRFAQESGLRVHPSVIRLSGANGTASNSTVTVPSLSIGYATAQDVRLFVYGRPLPVAGPDGTAVDGLFGGDFLSNYDIDLDLSAREVGIYQTEDCDTPAFRPLGQGGFAVPVARSDNRVVVAASINGRAMPFLLDSGASATLITTGYARALGVTPEAMAADPVVDVRGTGSLRVVAHLHRFSDFVLGSDHVRDPVIAVHDGSENILGDDFLRRNRVWISYAGRRLHVRPAPTEGGAEGRTR